jgi:hypothetical protein
MPKEHIPALGSRGSAEALAIRLEQLRDACTDNGFGYAAECLDDAQENLLGIAAGRVTA